MPVFAEIIENPAEQDLKDLCLIYDTPPGQPPVWLQEALDSDTILIGGRFNGRLLGAFSLLPQGDNRYRLEQLEVRNITRRRGVARQLLQLAMRNLPGEVRRIDVDLSEQPYLESLFTDVGFKPGDEDGQFHWTADS